MPVAIVQTFFNFSRIIRTVVYVQYILMRMRMLQDFVESIGELDNQFSPIVNRIKFGWDLLKIEGNYDSCEE
jgi:hypothetical protein